MANEFIYKANRSDTKITSEVPIQGGCNHNFQVNAYFSHRRYQSTRVIKFTRHFKPITKWNNIPLASQKRLGQRSLKTNYWCAVSYWNGQTDSGVGRIEEQLNYIYFESISNCLMLTIGRWSIVIVEVWSSFLGAIVVNDFLKLQTLTHSLY